MAQDPHGRLASASQMRAAVPCAGNAGPAELAWVSREVTRIRTVVVPRTCVANWPRFVMRLGNPAEHPYGCGGKPVDLRNHRAGWRFDRLDRTRLRRCGHYACSVPRRRDRPDTTPVGDRLGRFRVWQGGRTSRCRNRDWVLCSGAQASGIGAPAQVEFRTERGAGSPNVATAPTAFRDTSTPEMPVSRWLTDTGDG